MKSFKTLFADLPIGAKIALAPVLVALCLLAVALQSFLGNRQSATVLQEVSTEAIPTIVAANSLARQMGYIDSMIGKSLAFQGSNQLQDHIDTHDKQIVEEVKRLQDGLAEMKQRLASDPEAQSRLVQAEKALDLYRQSAADVLDMKVMDMTIGGTMLVSLDPLKLQLQKELDALVALQVERGQARTDAALAALQTSTLRTSALAGVALLLSAGVIALCVGVIVRSLRSAVTVATQVAQGDLSNEPLEASRDATGQVVAALNEVTSQLNSMVGDIRQASHEIELASTEIAQGNQDLSNRTEQTAASLQQAASAITALTQTVQDTAGSAGMASRLASDALSVAREGGLAVDAATETMGVISGQARRISEITAVIDGIAFQTNILALNAAVEAARAGEQGRGFAVVASEVRSLAQRSATAAKEIRSLITASVEQATAGADKVQAAGATMKRIVGSIEQVNSVVAQISQATSEQANSIDGVNRMVNAMENSTQQNAALVEQAAAATQSLKRQAEGLMQAVSAFRVAG